MVARLKAEGVLRDPALRAALLHVHREVLMPRAYVRRNGPGVQPGVWQLLDGSHPDDREEWRHLLHASGSVLVQHNGEDLTAQRRGTVTGGAITGLSSALSMTARFLQAAELQPRQRSLELGTCPVHRCGRVIGRLTVRCGASSLPAPGQPLPPGGIGHGLREEAVAHRVAPALSALRQEAV
jgi:hypothetical protein